MCLFFTKNKKSYALPFIIKNMILKSFFTFVSCEYYFRPRLSHLNFPGTLWYYKYVLVQTNKNNECGN